MISLGHNCKGHTRFFETVDMLRSREVQVMV